MRDCFIAMTMEAGPTSDSTGVCEDPTGQRRSDRLFDDMIEPRVLGRLSAMRNFSEPLSCARAN
jgi:hypothetical protein